MMTILYEFRAFIIDGVSGYNGLGVTHYDIQHQCFQLHSHPEY